MKSYLTLAISFLLMNCATVAQDKMTKEVSEKAIPTLPTEPELTPINALPVDLPYHQIPDYPEKMTAGTSIGRTIDGLGYRYYWATKDLTDNDLRFEPGNEGRSTEFTLDHLYGLSKMIANAPQRLPNVRPAPEETLTWEEKRAKTLHNFKTASDFFKASSDEEIAKFNIIFQRGESSNEVPVWNLLNGPVADAIYHVGQIVSFRRSSGNPMNPFVNVFMGKTKEE